jgi:Ca-activated chloride channel family protein
MEFLNPWVLFALVPLYFYYKKALTKESDAKDFNRQTTLLYLSLASILISLSRPVIPQSIEKEKFDAQEYIIALDASYSMMSEDIKPNRYEAAKNLIQELLTQNPKDRFSIFAFTSNTLLISPPTTDTAISKSALDALNPANILTKSTNLKELFTNIAKTSAQKKRVIIFSDGGDENNAAVLADICKKNGITPYFVAMATKEGVALKKDGVLLKDQYSSIVVSRSNPMLRELAQMSGGHYYEFGSSTLSELQSDLKADAEHKEDVSINVQSYEELSYIPIMISILLFLASVTKLHQLYVLPLLFLLPHQSHASLIDFYHFQKADRAYFKQEYHQAAVEFSKASPSVQSYFNTASCYYKAKEYKKALEYFDKIQTKSKTIKQQILYDMAACAIQLKRYDRAEVYYEQALALGRDEDALYNIRVLQKLFLKSGVNISDMLPPKSAQSKQNSSKKTGTQKDENKEGGGKSGSSQQQAGESSNGAGDSQKGDSQKGEQNAQSSSKQNKYQMSSQAYELINKGYTDEKQPW